ncbi:MAG: response regulator [Oscillospiraceae bacterium]|nr:response regulator [Oscillospiraceae bacterium]
MNYPKIRLNNIYKLSLILLICVLGIIILLNTLLIRRTESERVNAEGQVRLSGIAGRIDNSMYRSECLMDSVAMQIEQILSAGGDTEENLSGYFSDETIAGINESSDGSCFSAYAAYKGKLYINDFIPDETFVLDERSWYIGAKKKMGAAHVTEPYIDASTGEMCYSISKLLPDGETVVGLDFSLNEIQKYIEEMNQDGIGTSLIVNGNGMIVGHSQAELVGSNYKEHPFYNELVNKVFMLYGDSFEYSSEGVKYNIFSEVTNYDWYLVVCVQSNILTAGFSIDSISIIAFMVVFAVAIIVFFIRTCLSKAAAERALDVKDEFLKSMSYELKRPLAKIMNQAENLNSSDTNSTNTGSEISESAKELSQMLDNIISMSAINNFSNTKEEKSTSKKIVNHRRQIILITVILLAASVFAVIFNTNTQVMWGNTKMQKETELYHYQVQEWVSGNKAVLDVIADSIAAQDDFAADYDRSVTYLDNIVSKYDDISVAYLCNPEWEHTVLMNNRWEPDDNWHVEERQWYVDTLISDNNFNISAPYLDEQTGLYCTTLSKIVYDQKGNFIGILGIDYYLDKLIGILGESYTDTGYAFLTDIDGNILNHPYSEYQMTSVSSKNAADLSYRAVLTGDESVIIEDYDGQRRVCLAKTESVSGFKVIVTRNFGEIYGNCISSDVIYIFVFALCIIIINVIMRRLTLWQAKVNRELKEAADNAISAGKAKNNFLANMSHEIRTPINAVLGMNEMIMRESTEKPIVEYAANIQSAGRSLLALINEILDFSKIESGKMEIVNVEYDVSSLINDIVNMIKARADKKKLKFITEIDESIPAVLYGDDVRIKQVITNILTNAVKYTPAGNVRFRMKVLSVRGDSVKLEVSVSDTGIGIREEDLGKLFTSFQRLDQEKNRNIEGTGLGITIVQRLLNMMNSELNVSSVYGVGSTFSFVIEQKVVNADPMGNYERRFAASIVSNDKTTDKTASNARILVVDDNEMNLLVAKSLLKRTLASVDTAASGKECIEKLKDNIYDIVFLDHMMPEMDGIQTLEKIKEEQLAENTAFIALTANAIHGAKQTYLNAGFDDYLSKPFTGFDIEKCLFSHLNKSLTENVDSNSDNNSDADASDIGSAFDLDSALAAYDNDTDAYMNAVYDFCDNSRCNDLELDISLKDYKSYRTNLNIAINSADAVGLTELEQTAQELADAIDAGNTEKVQARHNSFIRMYRKATENLEEAVSARLS